MTVDQWTLDRSESEGTISRGDLLMVVPASGRPYMVTVQEIDSDFIPSAPPADGENRPFYLTTLEGDTVRRWSRPHSRDIDRGTPVPGTVDESVEAWLTYWRSRPILPPAWHQDITYRSGEQVLRENAVFASLSDNNRGNQPSASGTHWRLVANFSAVRPADITAEVADWAEQGNADLVPAVKLGPSPAATKFLRGDGTWQTVAAAAAEPYDWATEGNTTPIPISKLGGGGPGEFYLRQDGTWQAINLGPDPATWAERAEAAPIPASKLTNAPSALVERDRGTWYDNRQYRTGDIVTDHPHMAICIRDHTSSTTVPADGRPGATGATGWHILLSARFRSIPGYVTLSFGDFDGGSTPVPIGMYFSPGGWSATSSYIAQTVIRHDDATYVCIQQTPHPTGAATEPGTTGGAAYWQVL